MASQRTSSRRCFHSNLAWRITYVEIPLPCWPSFDNFCRCSALLILRRCKAGRVHSARSSSWCGCPPSSVELGLWGTTPSQISGNAKILHSPTLGARHSSRKGGEETRVGLPGRRLSGVSPSFGSDWAKVPKAGNALANPDPVIFSAAVQLAQAVVARADLVGAALL
jgi:hypothetical protein